MIECYRRGIQIGYCPQVDALDDLLTAEEHLYFYACIRGIARREMDQVGSCLLWIFLEGIYSQLASLSPFHFTWN